MIGNGKVFISHSHEDNQLCQPLIDCLHKWNVDYWFDTERMDAGKNIDEHVQKEISERDIFIRVCTKTSQKSFWVKLETGAFRGLQALEHKEESLSKRKMINLILEEDYKIEPFDLVTVFIDGVTKPFEQWSIELRQSLDLPPIALAYELPKYSRRLSKRDPGLFIILLDQSASMGAKFVGTNISKADMVSSAVNRLLSNLIDASPYNFASQSISSYAYMSIIGYNEGTYSLLSPTMEPLSLSAISKSIRGYTHMLRNVYNFNTNSFEEITSMEPYWVEPFARGGSPNLAQALLIARNLIIYWLQSPPEIGQSPKMDRFPPIIINITDGMSYDDENLFRVGGQIKEIATNQGETLLFNYHIANLIEEESKLGESLLVFPHNKSQVERFGQLAINLFELSSILPDSLVQSVKFRFEDYVNIKKGARGFIYNANIEILAELLSVGTFNQV